MVAAPESGLSTAASRLSPALGDSPPPSQPAGLFSEGKPRAGPGAGRRFRREDGEHGRGRGKNPEEGMAVGVVAPLFKSEREESLAS